MKQMLAWALMRSGKRCEDRGDLDLGLQSPH